MGFVVHPDFPKYRIYADGSIESLVFKNPRMLKLGFRGKYLGATLLNKDGELQTVYAHRIVAEAFHGMPRAGQECRHRDGDRTNNAAANICWGTRKQNMRDKEKHGTAPWGERHGMAKMTEPQVREIRKLYRSGTQTHQLMKMYGLCRMQVWRIATGKLWRHIV